ncbi:MFS transporter [Streptomyces marianii]|uniref:MFS transporter n=1 Tax=Streptomyces marianii TaxID=1817406 RepID=A0A5R9ECT1_9ACTN|nr:MFS transporter [Streptomyces marianii]TLQ47788.1 MFS transporter [Streptomyces marianii]
MDRPARAFPVPTAPPALPPGRGRAPSSGPASLRTPLAILTAAQFLVMFSASNINIVLPAIGETMDLLPVDLSWVVTAYVLAIAALLLPAGAAMDITGRRRLLLTGLAVLCGSSAMAGLAGGAGTLITARALQGAGVALAEPAVLCLLLALVPEPRRNKALGILGVGASLGGGTGVLLGGLLTEAVGWRGIFYATSALALLLALACAAGVPADAGSGRRLSRHDLKAAALMLVGLLALAYGMTEAGRSGWTRPAVLLPLGVGTVLLTAFAASEKRRDRPLLPLRVFSTGLVGPANIAMAVLGAVITGMFFFLSLYQQQILGDGPKAAALCQIPLSVAAALGCTLAPRLARRAGPRTALGMGLAALAAGLLWLGGVPGEGTFLQEAMAPSLLIGAGLGIAFVQITQAATAGVPHQDSGPASGLVTTARMIGGVFGLALLTGLAASRTAAADPLASEVRALHEGYQATFTVLGLAVLATALFLLAVFVRRRRAPRGAAPAPGSGPA